MLIRLEKGWEFFWSANIIRWCVCSNTTTLFPNPDIKNRKNKSATQNGPSTLLWPPTPPLLKTATLLQHLSFHPHCSCKRKKQNLMNLNKTQYSFLFSRWKQHAKGDQRKVVPGQSWEVLQIPKVWLFIAWVAFKAFQHYLESIACPQISKGGGRGEIPAVSKTYTNMLFVHFPNFGGGGSHPTVFTANQ